MNVRRVALFLIAAVTLAAQSFRVSLTWTDGNPAGATYSVYRASGPAGGAAPVKVASGITARAYDDTGLAAGVYTYQITATVGTVESALSPATQVLVGGPVSAPGMLTATVSPVVASPPPPPPPPPTTGPVRITSCTTAFYLDADCDGFGVAAPGGADADDADPSVHDYASAVAKWGSLQGFLAHLGYPSVRLFYLSPSGANAIGVPNDSTHPFATLAGLRARFTLAAGDVVLARAGTYSESFNLAYPDLSGAAGKPIVFMAYPGERPVWSSASDLVNSNSDVHDLVFDGLGMTHPTLANLGRTFFLKGKTERIVIRNIEAWGRADAIFAMDNMHGWLIENNVLRDNKGSHCVYLGARANPNSDITFRGNLVYNCGATGFQHNGRVSNLVVENNVVHDAKNAGISLLMGVHDSTVRNNLIFNNGWQGIVLYNYSSTDPTIQPFDISGNVIERNTVWVGSQSADPGVGSQTATFMPFDVANSSGAVFPFRGNVVRDNIFVSYDGPSFRIQRTDFDLASWVVTGNILWTTRSPSVPIMLLYSSFGALANTYTTLAEFQAISPGTFTANVKQDPGFAHADLAEYANPERFDFRNQTGKGYRAPQ